MIQITIYKLTYFVLCFFIQFVVDLPKIIHRLDPKTPKFSPMLITGKEAISMSKRLPK